jgi:ferrous iron transport protein B
MEENIAILVNVVDAANLDRNLYLTLQLLDFNIPIVLVLNQIDRARSLGLKVDKQLLERFLGVPVIPVSAAKGEGLEELKEAIVKKGSRGITMGFSSQVEEVIGRLSASLSEIIPEERQNVGSHSIRTLAIHLLEHDRLDEELIRVYPGLDKLIEKLQQEMGEEHPLCPNCFRGCAFCPAYDQQHPIFLTCLERTAKARQIAQEVIQVAAHRKNTWAERIETVVDRPVTGIPILLATTYFSFKLVMLVIEETEAGISILVHLLGKWLAHWIVVPPSGIWNMLAKSFAEGAIIPFSVVMPAMVSVYTLIALLEDTGMLPRLAMSLDRFMRLFGLPASLLFP